MKINEAVNVLYVIRYTVYSFFRYLCAQANLVIPGLFVHLDIIVCMYIRVCICICHVYACIVYACGCVPRIMCTCMYVYVHSKDIFKLKLKLRR